MYGNADPAAVIPQRAAGYHRAALAAAERYGLSLEIKHLVSDAQKFIELKRARFLLYPSRFEGYGIPPIGGSGLKLGTGNHKRKSGPDEDRDPGSDEADAIRRWFSPPLARLDEYTHEKTVTCAYTFTSDERFALHREERLWVVSACSGHGYKFGAAIGRRVARHVTANDENALVAWLEARD